MDSRDRLPVRERDLCRRAIELAGAKADPGGDAIGGHSTALKPLIADHNETGPSLSGLALFGFCHRQSIYFPTDGTSCHLSPWSNWVDSTRLDHSSYFEVLRLSRLRGMLQGRSLPPSRMDRSRKSTTTDWTTSVPPLLSVTKIVALSFSAVNVKVTVQD